MALLCHVHETTPSLSYRGTSHGRVLLVYRPAPNNNRVIIHWSFMYCTRLALLNTRNFWCEPNEDIHHQLTQGGMISGHWWVMHACWTRMKFSLVVIISVCSWTLDRWVVCQVMTWMWNQHGYRGSQEREWWWRWLMTVSFGLVFSLHSRPLSKPDKWEDVMCTAGITGPEMSFLLVGNLKSSCTHNSTACCTSVIQWTKGLMQFTHP